MKTVHMLLLQVKWQVKLLQANIIIRTKLKEAIKAMLSGLLKAHLIFPGSNLIDPGEIKNWEYFFN